MQKLNGQTPADEQPKPERVGYTFSAQQWDMVSGLAVQLVGDAQRVALEHQLRQRTPTSLRSPEVAAEVVELVGSLAANQALATARHLIAQQAIFAERIAAAEAQEQDARRRRSIGLPPEGDDRGETTGESNSAAGVIQAP
jgi:hypothetical protein